MHLLAWKGPTGWPHMFLTPASTEAELRAWIQTLPKSHPTRDPQSSFVRLIAVQTETKKGRHYREIIEAMMAIPELRAAFDDFIGEAFQTGESSGRDSIGIQEHFLDWDYKFLCQPGVFLIEPPASPHTPAGSDGTHDEFAQQLR